jgi:hypothetical protein
MLLEDRGRGGYIGESIVKSSNLRIHARVLHIFMHQLCPSEILKNA